ncbi:L,D-transpeptidase family protein [Vibrio sp. V27_P1S3P104]|uniref:L,D-transpeptidase family protein n=1 Tax=unclassified Vibrio TaxID=2614977 RepID=UPI001372CEBA|nr:MULTISPECIES: L,D-transpeptidase family protein [unclassified Vibrio]NAW69895.1 L,D-transpeptidase family protein [Vibrio sp. V28_P6S34P95]NAX03939.1 L,D-transpeptidase family protein [Vibrio sp. V30_P3S12P165]NAX33931.1 L,D-transpeptidase family protein [Vibrio sp. V29_P1S30P107]NAX38495.1 L,D-transpeptidase family protein [Vibrio sp. V27_P1S3P104]NAX39207.1 L,D-transpeptidase family protein [Vibrio sp. V26_P1S5P106]
MWLSYATTSQATVYDFPKEGSRLVGRMQYHVVSQGETLANIANQYEVGFLALMAANKGVDPFLPAEGSVLTIPSQMILPDVPYEGIVINLAELRLYYFQPEQRQVHIFPVGIGRIGRDTPEMETYISQKRPNPTWTPPQSIRHEYLQRGIELPAVVPAGPNNPLGEYAMRLAYGSGEYLIHGTNKDFGIGMRVSAGCIRMEPKDIEWLFQQAERGMKVRVINEPIKVTLEVDRSVFIEAHEPLTRSDGSKKILSLPIELTWWMREFNQPEARARAAILAQNGIPIEVVPPSEQ